MDFPPTSTLRPRFKRGATCGRPPLLSPGAGRSVSHIAPRRVAERATWDDTTSNLRFSNYFAPPTAGAFHFARPKVRCYGGQALWQATLILDPEWATWDFTSATLRSFKIVSTKTPILLRSLDTSQRPVPLMRQKTRYTFVFSTGEIWTYAHTVPHYDTQDVGVDQK